jgi:hypothetical protein
MTKSDFNVAARLDPGGAIIRVLFDVHSVGSEEEGA